MLNITWIDKQSAERLGKQTRVHDILEDISKQNWYLAGHVVKMKDNA